MQFEWDAEKARRNLAKHGIGFELAQRVWDDPFHFILDEMVIDREMRLRAIGIVGVERTLLVVHTHPDPNDRERIRIVSARKATPHERRRYERETI